MDDVQKLSERLERERTYERQLRMKIEEEFNLNSRNHEQEVQLRLQFEAKLNSMHSVHRDLTTRYEVSVREQAEMKEKRDVLAKVLGEKEKDIQRMAAKILEHEATIESKSHQIDSLVFDLKKSGDLVKRTEERSRVLNDELEKSVFNAQFA